MLSLADINAIMALEGFHVNLEDFVRLIHYTSRVDQNPDNSKNEAEKYVSKTKCTNNT